MSLVLPSIACLIILGSVEAIIIAEWAQCNLDCIIEITVSLCILEGTNTRASGIGGYFPHLLKYQDIWSISSILKEPYFISDAP
jgi:hypothetical protein